MIRTRQAFDDQLQELQQRLVTFGTFVETMLEQATRALATHDAELGRQVAASDDTADQMDLQIEQMCMRLLALQQPMSGDLRFIGTAMKVIADIERIGDYSVDIAKAAIRLVKAEYFRPLVDIPRLSTLVQQMLRQALEALVRHDLDLARQVAALDDQVDDTWHALRDELRELMQQHPEHVPQALELFLVARYLERIADHIVNIVERVTYVETGKLEDLSPDKDQAQD